MYESGNVYRLYDKNEEFLLNTPKKEHLSIFIQGGMVQIMCGNKAFNHYAAIKEMEKMGLISPKEKEEVNNKPLKKPPLGLIPKHIHDEKVARERIKEIKEAIERYRQAGLVVSSEWIMEWEELKHINERSQKKESLSKAIVEVGRFLEYTNEYGLATEVTTSAMFFLKENPGSSINGAFEAAIS